jgi:hypothetical protein
MPDILATSDVNKSERVKGNRLEVVSILSKANEIPILA